MERNENEVYDLEQFDKYPYYSDFGASSYIERFYLCYGDIYMWCEVNMSKRS